MQFLQASVKELSFKSNLLGVSSHFLRAGDAMRFPPEESARLKALLSLKEDIS